MSQLFPVEQSVKTSDDYLTPRWVFDTLALTFDLDVAAPPWDTHVPAARKFTRADDGLAQPWEGRVWMNPPYSKPILWIERFIAHGDGIALVPASNGRWFGTLWETAHAITIPIEPVIFEGGGIPIRTVFAAFGAESADAISRLGRVR